MAVSMKSSKNVILQLKNATEGGTAMQKHVSGRRKITTSEDWYVSQVAKRKEMLLLFRYLQIFQLLLVQTFLSEPFYGH